MNTYKALCITLASFCCITTNTIVYANTITAQPFKKDTVNEKTLNEFCTSYQLDCEEKISLWHTNTKPKTYYLIDNTPQLLQFEKIGRGMAVKDFKLTNKWDFSEYQHINELPYTSDMGASERLSLYPALYPVNKNKVAVAVLKHYFTGFSGGGAHEDVADFVMLEPNGKYKTALQDVLFSEGHSYRACFTEEEYDTSQHCHEEGWIILHINYKDIGKPYYQWTLKYSKYHWDADTPKSSTTKKIKSFKVIPFLQQADIAIND